jgi:alpha-N-arabinofuranosidase
VLSAYVRGSASKLRVSLRKAGVSGELCGADLAGVAGGDGGDWQQRRVDLSLPDGALATGEIVELWVMAKGGGRFWLDLVFLLPADHLDGCDPDVIRYLKESKLPLYRFPGGNFVSGYHWRDGVGPLAERPLLMNPAWDCPEPNFIGTDEHLAFCQAVVCEPMICVNAGNGSPREAAQWVEYCNGTSDTEMGKLRADNGHPEPYGVRYWEVGNELYGGWQIGSCTPEEYAERYEAFQNAMLEVDESILLIGNGQNLNWNEPILKRKGTLVRSLSTHRLVGGGARDEEDADAVFDALMASTTGYDADISALAEQAAGFGWDVKTAVTELQVFTNRPHLPNNNSMAEALFLGGTIHSALRLGDVVEMITHSALVNHGGGLRKQKEIVYPNPVHWVSHMYGNLEPARLVKTEWSCSTFDASIDAIGTYEGAPVLDVASAVSEDSAWLYVMVMNRSRTESVTTTIDLEGFDAGPKGRVETVVGRSFLDANTWDDPALVGIESETVDVVEGKMRVTLRPHSVNIVKVEGRGRNSGN